MWQPIRLAHSKASKHQRKQVQTLITDCFLSTMCTSPDKRVQWQPRAQKSPSPTPDAASSHLLHPGSPFGRTLKGCLPLGSSILLASECPNKEINLLACTVVPGSNFPNVRLELDCTTMCFVHVGSKTGPDTPVIAPGPHPMVFQTVLTSIFTDERTNTINTQVLAELAALASSYQPTPNPQPTIQRPNSQNVEDMVMENTNDNPSSQAIIPCVPESSVSELPIDLGN